MPGKLDVPYSLIYDEQLVAEKLLSLDNVKDEQTNRSPLSSIRSMWGGGYEKILCLVIKLMLNRGEKPVDVEWLIFRYLIIVSYIVRRNKADVNINEDWLSAEFDRFRDGEVPLTMEYLKTAPSFSKDTKSVYEQQYCRKEHYSLWLSNDKEVDEFENELNDSKFTKAIPFFTETCDILKFVQNKEDSTRFDTLIADILPEREKWEYFDIKVTEETKSSFAMNLNAGARGASLGAFFFVLHHLIKYKVTKRFEKRGNKDVIKPQFALGFDPVGYYSICLFGTKKLSLSQIKCIKGDYIDWSSVEQFEFMYKTDPADDYRKYRMSRNGLEPC